MSERDIFIAARGRTDPTARAAFLAEACGGDAALRERLERLLRADSGPDSLLDNPAAALSDTEERETHAWTPTADADRTPEKDTEEALPFLAPAGQPGVLGRMDHYDVLEMVGKGGMGLVLKAFDTRLHRVVAIKVMAPTLAVSATARKRFVREAQAGAAVNHRNVVTIHAVEAEHSPPYLVMELVEGRSLAETFQDEGPPELKEILRIGSEVASGLAAAHTCGLIHRDIKPANILLEAETGRVKITDFGLARAANDARLTQSGLVSGTPKYMSPEQALGQTLDARSDLFSLGGVLYFLCTGQAPFRARNTLAVLNQVIKDEPQPIRELNPAIPVWLCDVVARLQAKDAAQRIQTAEEIAELLSPHSTAGPAQGIVKEPLPAALAGQASSLPLHALPGRLDACVTPPRRLKVWLAPAVGGTALAIALAIVWFAHRGGQAPVETGQLPAEIDRKKGGQPNPGGNLSGKKPTPNIFAPFSPATLANRDAFRLPLRKRLRHGKPCDCSCIPRGFSPDGKWLLTISDGDPVVRVWDVATGKQHKELPCTGDLIPGPTFSHNSAWLAGYGVDGVVRLWDTRTFTLVRTLERQPWRIRSAAFDTADRILAIGRQDGQVQFWEVGTGRKVNEFSVASSGRKLAEPVLSLSFLPGNKRLALFAPEQTPWYDRTADRSYYHCVVQTLDGDENSPRFTKPLWEWKAPDTHFVSFSVAGDKLYFMKDRYKEVPSLAVADAATGTVREIKSLPGVVPIAVLGVPGRGLLVGYSDKVARFWNTESGKVEWEVPLPSREDHGHFALHPDGNTVAFGADDMSWVHFFSLKTRREFLPPP